tara:strand:- start:811 stop:1788 length:978 start_codon:yes stop_codon:yes gene_type:complete
LTENSEQKIFVAGHNGMVGSAILRILKKNEKLEILVKNKSELDLSNQSKVDNFLKKEKPSQIYICAAKVGGILANSTYPVDFLYSNLMIQNNLINGAFENGIKKILFLGSSCIYPKYSKQPIDEESLLSGILEPTNEPYAIAKIAGIKLCDSYNRQFGKKYGIDYRSVMPTNLYGYGDNYDLKDSHVIPGLIKKFHLAKTLKKKKVFVWGSGKPKREFLHVDDLAKACVHVMSLTKKKYYQLTYDQGIGHINIGSGEEVSIKKLSEIISKIVGFKGEISFDVTKPDGTPRKILNSYRIMQTGWKPKLELVEGIKRTYEDFSKNEL